MRTESALSRLFLQEDLNFLITNRIPRRYATMAFGHLSEIKSRSFTKVALAFWQHFGGDLHLEEAEHTNFESIQDCFTRRLKPGVRPCDPDPQTIVSPCDAIVGACGRVFGDEVFQAKGYPYRLHELLQDPALVERYRNGTFVTLRLKSNFYHRFHAPVRCRVGNVTYISGDTWNVNPIALARVEKLFCKNERAVIDLELDGPGAITLVPIAAILVASIHLHGLDAVLDLRYRGPNPLPWNVSFEKGAEMGHFRSGSTIVVFASSPFTLAENIIGGAPIRVGQPLLRRRTA